MQHALLVINVRKNFVEFTFRVNRSIRSIRLFFIRFHASSTFHPTFKIFSWISNSKFQKWSNIELWNRQVDWRDFQNRVSTAVQAGGIKKKKPLKPLSKIVEIPLISERRRYSHCASDSVHFGVFSFRIKSSRYRFFLIAILYTPKRSVRTI